MKIRLLAFWEKEDSKATLVLATPGFIKKTDKVPIKENIKAVKIKDGYFINEKK